MGADRKTSRLTRGCSPDLAVPVSARHVAAEGKCSLAYGCRMPCYSTGTSVPEPGTSVPEARGGVVGGLQGSRPVLGHPESLVETLDSVTPTVLNRGTRTSATGKATEIRTPSMRGGWVRRREAVTAKTDTSARPGLNTRAVYIYEEYMLYGMLLFNVASVVVGSRCTFNC